MRLASFRINGRLTYGVATDEGLFETNNSFRQRFPDLKAAIAAGLELDLTDNVVQSATDSADVVFAPALPNPDKILCVGVNYRPHIEEMGREIPDHPVVFVRFSDSLVGHGQAIVRPRASEQFDFEGELALVVGKRARHVSHERALEYVAGYSCFMDGSVRDWQTHTMQFTPGKNFHNSGAMGPYIVTSDEIPDPAVLQLTTRVNGEAMQLGELADLVFDIPSLIEYCSTFSELMPGDVIATGTPGGVGAARKPPIWLKPGDTVEVDIPGVGQLRSPVWDESHTSGS